MKVEALKEQARRHEQREEWKKAFDLYTAALRNQDEDEPPDITLFNRVGDIQTRLGQIDGAVEQYEKAIHLYLEAELPNNAIAICKKVLRNLPDRTIFFLRMGQIRAGQGFITDARQNFLTYAEKQTSVGDVESALNALIEFVDLSPEDVEIRQSLASQLESHGRTAEAVEQYTEVYRRLILMGRSDEAQAISEQLEELDPELVLPDEEGLVQDEPSETEELVLESTSLGGIELKIWGEDEEEGVTAVEDLERTDLGGEAPAPADAADLEGLPEEFEGAPAGVEEESLPSFGFESGDTEEDSNDTALPAFGFESEEDEEEASDLSGFGFPGEGVTETEEFGFEEDPLPLLEFDDDEEEEESLEDSLPLLGFEVEGEEGEEGEEEEEEEAEETPLEVALEEAAFDAAALGLMVDEEEEEEVAEDLAPAAEDLASPIEALAPPVDHLAAAEQGDMALAMEMVRNVIEAEPDNVELHQRLVEYAFRSNDQDVLVSAYLELASCLARTGAPVKARAVFQQVLSLSPGHEEATTAIQALDGTPAAGTPASVASSEEYVDLGAMILGEEAEETTRWTVAAEAPTGDDEADFAKMLGQFKEKVSEHLSADDVGAHHDLGTAYMEMGLLDEAIGEFQMALRASPDHLPTHEIMGRCWMAKGNPDMAVRALNRALESTYEIEDEMIGIYYLMGQAQEALGNRGEAVEFYEKVFSLDINFEDVTERLRALR